MLGRVFLLAADDMDDLANLDFISLVAAARTAGVAPRTLRSALKRAELPSARLIANRWLLLESEVDAWARARRAARGGEPERRGRPPRLSVNVARRAAAATKGSEG